jgi:NAD(P)H-quinone oxidoreductase subunit 5
MILTRFSPLFSGDVAQIILLVLSTLSVLLGTGIMLVQVDYKRQLVGSTIAQMGFMLIQCALGAYVAAITHAVLHGLFKSTLFLQAGSAIRSNEPVMKVSKPSTFHVFVSYSLGLLTGFVFWLSSPEMTYQFISAVILGWSVTVAWQQISAFESGRKGLFSGVFMLFVAGIIFIFVHHTFHDLLHDLVQIQNQSPKYFALFLFVILLSASGLGIWLSNNRSSRLFAIVYLWLVQLGEPRNDLVETHPKYIDNSAHQGGL